MQLLSIGELSRRSGVKVPTIRYYEAVGLLPAPPRTAGNQRRYGRAELDRLQLVAHARDMGFSVESLRSLLRLVGCSQAPCADVDAVARAHLAEVDERIASLTRLRGELVAMLSGGRHGTVAECRIVEVLSDHQHCAAAH